MKTIHILFASSVLWTSVDGFSLPLSVDPLVAGMIAGAIGVGVAYPLDTIKVKTQTYMEAAPDGTCAPSSWALARTILEEEGIDPFYAGVTSTMAGQAIIKGTVFAVYEGTKNILGTELDVDVALLSTTWIFFAACVSGAASTFVVTPVERVKCVMQAAPPGSFLSPIACVGQVLDEDGTSGLFLRGFGATFLREVPAYGFYFLAYEATKAILLTAVDASQQSVPLAVTFVTPLIPLVSGAAAGVASWVPVYPIDVVKTNLQASVDGGRQDSFMQVTQRLWDTGGVGIFWDGIGPKVARAIVNHATTFFIYDLLTDL